MQDTLYFTCVANMVWLSCTHLTRRTSLELKGLHAKKLGKVGAKVLIRLTAFVEKTPVLSQEDKDAIVNGLADWASRPPDIRTSRLKDGPELLGTGIKIPDRDQRFFNCLSRSHSSLG